MTDPQAVSPRILLSAFACDPTMGSEPYVGWNWLNVLIDAGFAVVVATRVQHRDNIMRRLGAERRVELIAFDLPGMADYDHRGRWIKPYYLAWQCALLGVVLRRKSALKLDYAMHVTYNVVELPGLLWALRGVRFIWGPVGGGQSPPDWSRPLYGPKWWKQRLRTFSKQMVRFNPLVNLAVAKADHVFVANGPTRDVLPRRHAGKYVSLLETAIGALPDGVRKPARRPDDELNLLWVGQLEPRKGLNLLLEALLALTRAEPELCDRIRLRVVGAGEELQAHRDWVQENGLHEQVALLGAIPFQEVGREYLQADALVFSSVQDTSGNVVLEAMSHGIPVIAIHHQGVAEMANEDSALLLQASSYQDAVNGFADKILFALQHPEAAHAIGLAGREHLEKHHCWVHRRASFREALYGIQ